MMINAAETIRALSDELENHTIAIRREIHQHPELSFHETATAALVCRELSRMGVPYEKSPCQPGVVGLIDSGKPGKLLLLRADMDALPIQEETGLPYASQVPNVMHACGHDVHTANLLAVAEILNRTRELWSGRVKLVFQPAEENGGGGREMIKAGLMDELPDACFALHVENGMPGKILVGKRYLTAYSDGYFLTVHGKATHSSAPEDGTDAIYIASTIVTALHGIISRNLSPMERSTLNVGLFHGGTAANIVADKAEMAVMMRNLSKESREEMCRRIEAIATGIAQSLGGSCEFQFRSGYPAVYNDGRFTDFVTRVLDEHAGSLFQDLGAGQPEDWLITGEHPILAAEDFGYYSQKAPSCLIWVGTGGDAAKHNPGFRVDEAYIKLCTRAMATVAVEFLNS